MKKPTREGQGGIQVKEDDAGNLRSSTELRARQIGGSLCKSGQKEVGFNEVDAQKGKWKGNLKDGEKWKLRENSGLEFQAGEVLVCKITVNNVNTDTKS